MSLGKGGKQTIGYKYNVGVHAAFCHGPLDHVSRIRVDERTCWEGLATGGTIEVSAPELFGGEEREGGVSGSIDILMGEPTQTKNTYLLDKIGSAIPAYRGVASMVFKGFYWGNNPYLKPVDIRARRILKAQDGEEQWYPAKAIISLLPEAATPDFYTKIRISWSNASTAKPGNGFELNPDDQGPTITNTMTNTAIDHVVVQNFNYIEFIWKTVPLQGQRVKLRLQFSTGSVDDDMKATASFQQYTGANSILLPQAGSHSFGEAFDVRGLWPDSWYFSLPGPTVEETVDGDMNPSHIIRECLTNQDWGMGYSVDDVDDVSFTAAADTLFDESMGISLIWDKQARIEDFIAEIVRHIDAALFVSRKTGKFVLKLIRADYDVGALITLDESNIESISNPARAAFGELVSAVTVVHWQSRTGKNDSVTVSDPAAVQQLGAEIGTTLQYPGFTNSAIATRVASRDYRALSNPFLSCTILTGDIARDLDIGDTFKLTWGKWKLQEVVMRITGFAMSDARSANVRLTCIEDVFDTPDTAVIVQPPDGWVDPSQPPEKVTQKIAFETPYYEAVQAAGQVTVDTNLATDPALGYISAAAMRPGNAINGRLWTDAGDSFAEAGTLDFCPGGFLSANMGLKDSSATLTEFSDLDLASVGEFFQIDDELFRLDSIDPDTGEITFGRGVLDTVPSVHLAGVPVFFWDTFSGTDPEEYASGEAVDVRITAASGAGVSSLADAQEVTVTLAQRAYRPYPPGNLTINGESYALSSYDEVLTVAWAHRDRLQQTSGELADHFDGNIGPEAGTTYRVRVYIDDVLDYELDNIAGTSDAVTPSSDGNCRIEVHSKRDGIYSLFAATHEFPYTASDVRYTEDDEIRITDDGSYRTTED